MVKKINEKKYNKKMKSKAQLKIQDLKNQRFLAPSSSKKGQLKIQDLKNQRFLAPSSSKKGQLKIQEMAFMLVAVIIFFVIVGLFALMIFYNQLYNEAEEIAERRTLTAVTYLADSPEFECVEGQSNCIDGDKLMALLKKSNYTKMWPFSSLTIIRFHAFAKPERELVDCSMQNYPKCDRFNVYSKGVKEIRISSFAALCMTDYEMGHFRKCEIVKILAGTEQIKPEK